MIRFVFIFIIVGIFPTKAQTILMNEGINADGLWCFPVLDQPDTYKYLPLEAHLALHENGLPQFSYMRYILEKPSENSMNSITDADGGGILHFLVLYDTPKEKVLDAEQFLQEQQNILENQRQQNTRRVQQAFFMIHVLFVALNDILLILNYQQTGEWNLLYLGLSFMSLILILRYLKTGFVYQRK